MLGYSFSAVSQGRVALLNVGGAASITGLEIDFQHDDWVGLVELQIFDDEGNEILSGLTADSTLVESLDDIDAGAFGTNSTYDDNEDHINGEGWPESETGSLAGNAAQIHWSASDSSGGLKVFVKPSAAISGVSRVRVILTNSWSYDIPTLVVKDQDGNTLTQIVAPNSKVDRIFAENTLFNAGSPTSQKAGFEWYFEDYTEERSVSDVIGVAPVHHWAPRFGDLNDYGAAAVSNTNLVDNAGLGITTDENGPDYVEADGSNVLKLGDISSSTLLDAARQTDADGNNITKVGFWRIPSIAAGSVYCGSATSVTGGSRPTVGTSVVQGTAGISDEMRGDASSDAPHTFHNDHSTTGSTTPIDTDFVWMAAEQTNTPEFAVQNNFYRGWISNGNNNGLYMQGTNENDNTRNDNAQGGDDALVSADSSFNGNFYIFGMETDGVTPVVVDAQPDGTRFYELMIFDQYLTFDQMFKLHKWIELTQRRNIYT